MANAVVSCTPRYPQERLMENQVEVQIINEDELDEVVGGKDVLELQNAAPIEEQPGDCISWNSCVSWWSW
jgi:hypothetical protein